MKREIQLRFLIVIALAVFTSFFTLPSSTFGGGKISQYFQQFKVTLGLDLAGGTELDYKADISSFEVLNNDDDPNNDVDEAGREEILDRVRDAINERVNPAEIGEIVIKRSQFDDEEHILVQMPPSSNVEKAKQDAQKDNRLEFFEEDPSLETEAQAEITERLNTITTANWTTTKTNLETTEEVVLQTNENRTQAEMTDPVLAEKLFAAPQVGILKEVVDTQTESVFNVDESGQIDLSDAVFPEAILGIVNILSVGEKEEEETRRRKYDYVSIPLGNDRS